VGMTVDPVDAYAWGWEEVREVLDQMAQLCEQIRPGATLPEVVGVLEHDPECAAPDAAAFIRFVEERQASALANLDGVHFDVPSAGRHVTISLAPPGGPPGAYYVPPSEDFSRPGSIWYSIEDPDAPRPLYQEVSTAYHEGFPGHHLQLATSLAARDRLSRYQRLWVWYPGLGEGWALYTERLMAELGYFEKPEYVLGMLANGLFRAVRVVVDLGLHLGFEIPASAPIDGGESWSFERAVSYMQDVALQPPGYAESEVLRYLGWPGQAISYKLGERELLDIRSRYLTSGGDLRGFHREVLAHGDIRLDRLRRSMFGHASRDTGK
ncbi:MAG: DUF885 domain-containing protein, partial [Acidimicrobiia bacterium]|nr:DUF885 domain-containing protein [Acidimicrobiia bacterium]